MPRIVEVGWRVRQLCGALAEHRQLENLRGEEGERVERDAAEGAASRSPRGGKHRRLDLLLP